MSINPPVLPPSWGPAPDGRSAHALLEPLYAWADVTDGRLTDLEAGGGTSGPGAPVKIGGTAPADGWHFANGGTTPDPGDIPVTANTPTADDSTDTITWTPKTGVQYVIGGTIRTPPYNVGAVDTTVIVTAQAAAGYVLIGTSSWSFEFTTPAMRPITSDSFSVDATNLIGQTTDAALGGSPMVWEAAGSDTLFAKVGGALVRGPGNSNAFVALANETADQSLTVRFDELPTSGELHMIVRRNGLSGAHSIRLYVGPTVAQLRTVVGGAVTDIGDPIPLSGPCTLELKVEGPVVTVLKDGAQAVHSMSAGADVPAAGLAGLAFSGPTAGLVFSIDHVVLNNKI